MEPAFVSRSEDMVQHCRLHTLVHARATPVHADDSVADGNSAMYVGARVK